MSAHTHTHVVHTKPLLEAFTLETMRLTPPSRPEPRLLTSDTTIDGVSLVAGACVCVRVRACVRMWTAAFSTFFTAPPSIVREVKNQS